ncbi:MAG: hypothetical protein ACOX5C_00255 [Acutalibacteraceae bacterium]|jgi:hypothetical protein
MEETAVKQKKKTGSDLIIICAVTMIVLGVFMAFQDTVEGFAKDTGIHILLRTVTMALLQFGTAGLGITLVALIRKESFVSFGLRKKNALKSIVFCTLSYVPYIIFCLATGQIDSYMPFQTVWMTSELRQSNFAVGALGYLIIAVAWGFFEGFNYVVISDKINKLLPVKHRWLNWGAIICAVMCILIHGMIGVTMEGIIEMLTVFIAIYGMLVTKTVTGNAWGCVFLFVFLWNAF